jgi:uncharacterized FAD-dependent dehydrogenase
MQKQLQLQLTPAEAADSKTILQFIANAGGHSVSDITGYQILKKSIDARSSRQVWVNMTLLAFLGEPYSNRKTSPISFKDVGSSTFKVVIVGAGPAGLFAALKCLELGIKPHIIERGKEVRARRRDLAALNKEGIVNPESNYCFGEGGAGTYSDGKLYTRSNKRGDINRILQLFVQHGAEEQILYNAHPHIGTNKLPQIIQAIRMQILSAGGIIEFEKKMVDFTLEKGQVTAVITADGDTITGDAVVLATGHSANDIFALLGRKKVAIESKPFALGVRIEHPQEIIDRVQYHCFVRDENLPPASYGLVEQVNGKGVFSFCMCPGGIIAPAATLPGQLVVNGWSPSKRNNPYANSGMVVEVAQPDALSYFKEPTNKKLLQQMFPDVTFETLKTDPLLLLYFQAIVEKKSFDAGGGKFVAPANRMVDFSSNKTSTTLTNCSYVPGLVAHDLQDVLPHFIRKNLQDAFIAFGKKMKGYYTNEALVVATESRTSSPVRIPRNQTLLCHPDISNLYPCAEGAGYAGGIVSAAMDGERVIEAIFLKHAKSRP